MVEKVEIGDVTWIYSLKDPETNQVRYVGKTVQPLRERLIQHKRSGLRGGNLPVNRWMAKRCGVNLTGPYISLLEIVKPEDDWQERERHWIRFFKDSGCELLNLTEGGDGLPGHRFTEEHKAKISAALKTGAWLSCEQCNSKFWTKKNEINRGNPRFCSKKCYQVWQKGKPKKISDDFWIAGIAAAARKRSEQTHCKRGHKYSELNTYINSNGARVCKECMKIHKKITWSRESVKMFEHVKIGDSLLFLGDCLEVLPTLGRVDVTITDPPYGEATHVGARTKKTISSAHIDFKSMSRDQFVLMCREVVSVTNRWVVMTCDWKYATIIEEDGLPLIRLGVWVKTNSAPQFTGDRPGGGWEAVAILHRNGHKRWNGGGSRAVWDIPLEADVAEKGKHPTQKPVRLLLKWTAQFSDHGETVLDPFMGSGTTGVACVRQGRKFIGIERERKYFDIACERISKEHAQPRFELVQRAKPAEQLTMI